MRADRAELEEYLRLRGFVSVADIARRFEVSEVTARRYVKRLGDLVDVRLVPGGAVSLQPPLRQVFGQGILLGLERERTEKLALAAYAASLIERGETIFIDSGSTCYYLVRALPENRNLTVITHSLDIAVVAKGLRGVRVICPGGEVDDVLNIFVGTFAERQFAAFYADRAFLGVGSIDAERGTHESTLVEVPLKNLLNRNSRHSYLLADASKFARHANFGSISLADMRSVVTTWAADPVAIAALRSAGVEVLVAPGPRGDPPTTRSERVDE